MPSPEQRRDLRETLTTRREQPLHIALPPGIGDIHWALLKMGALRKLLGRPFIVHVAHDEKHTSTVAYLKMVPWIADAVDDRKVPPAIPQYFPGRNDDPALYGTLNGCAGLHGYDYCLFPNFILDQGGHVEDFLPGLEIDYDYEMVGWMGAAPGEWTGRHVLYPSGYLPNRAFHNGKWTVQDWVDVARATDRPLLVGSDSSDDMGYTADVSAALSDAGIPHDNVCGRTPMPLLINILKTAKSVVGLNCGVPILSSAWGVPTVMLWGADDFPIEGCHNHHNKMKTCWLNPRQEYPYVALSYGHPLTNGKLAATALTQLLAQG